MIAYMHILWLITKRIKVLHNPPHIASRPMCWAVLIFCRMCQSWFGIKFLWCKNGGRVEMVDCWRRSRRRRCKNHIRIIVNSRPHEDWWEPKSTFFGGVVSLSVNQPKIIQLFTTQGPLSFRKRTHIHIYKRKHTSRIVSRLKFRSKLLGLWL